MGIPFLLFIINAVVINRIYPDTAGCMYNFLLLKQYAYMRNLTFFIVKESKVTCTCLIYKTYEKKLYGYCIYPGQ